MKCNGCGGKITSLAGFFGYGSARGPLAFDHPTIDNDKQIGVSDYIRTLCPKCTKVMKDILLNSDLSEHWDE